MLHVHLDPLGGMAGDMFIAAILDARPELESVLNAAVVACELPPGWRIEHGRRKTKGLDSRTFDVIAPDGPTRASGRYAQLMERIDAMALSAGVKSHAKSIYTLLGECEATVHGIPLADVHFHELADWDSLVDIVGAGALIDALDAGSWSASAIPLGSGQVRTAHGPLPVPAPATARLIAGMVVQQDGIPGERVTPTGAAILAHLGISGDGMQPRRTRAISTGLGAGTRELDGCANVVRAQLLENLSPIGTAAAESVSVSLSQGPIGPMQTDRVHVLEFEVDDQSPEELASGLDQLRAQTGVLDVFSYVGAGKKNRMSFAVRILCTEADVAAVAEACFTQTTTLGLRSSTVTRAILPRKLVMAAQEKGEMQVKLTERPGGLTTAKAEHDDVLRVATTQAARRTAAMQAEAAALRGLNPQRPDQRTSDDGYSGQDTMNEENGND